MTKKDATKWRVIRLGKREVSKQRVRGAKGDAIERRVIILDMIVTTKQRVRVPKRDILKASRDKVFICIKLHFSKICIK